MDSRRGLRLAALGAAAASWAALSFRDLRRSLWIDEFGTLWVVEGGLATAWERAIAFQGQSPFYYLLSWLSVHGLGESEIALRLPALVCGLLAVVTLYLIGRQIGGDALGQWCAAVGFLSALVIDAGRSGRPYALALLMSAITLLGFLRAVHGVRGGRLLFVLGGVGLFYAHYLLSLFSVGLGLAYLVLRDARRAYPVPRFVADVGVQALVAAPGLGQVMWLWARSESLSWVSDLGLPVIAVVAMPFVFPVLAGSFFEGTERARSTRNASIVLLLVAAAQVGSLLILAFAGTRLIETRYMVTLAVPAVLLAGRGIWLAVSEWSAARGMLAVLALWLYVGANLAEHGRLRIVVREDWRGAVERVEALHRQEPAPVLYRSGFIEDDQRSRGLPVTNAVLAPLRSPGRTYPDWEVVPLTATWTGLPGEEAFLETTAVDALERQGTALVLFRGLASDYFDPFLAWLGGHYAGRLQVESVVDERGVVTARLRVP